MMPTVLDLLGIPFDPEEMDGRSRARDERVDFTPSEATIGPSEVEALRSLGYLGGD